ncbi:MAG: transglutaminase-like domain-containing protein [Planctomycetota bacterium]
MISARIRFGSSQRGGASRQFRLVWCALGLAILNGWAMVSPLWTQQKEAVRDAADESAPRYQEAEETVWEFGLRIEAAGQLTGVTATCPVPVSWSEQEVVQVEELATATVSRVEFDELPQGVRLLVVKVNRLAAGEVAEATLRVRIQKRTIVPPLNVEGLRIPEKPGGKLKPFLQASPSIEIGNKEVKAFAASIEVPPEQTAWQQVESIYDQIREKIPYEFDPTIRTCMEAIDRGKGDCEELSSLFIAVCRLKGIPARAVWIPEHTYPEFYLENEQGEGHWFPCQLAGTRQFGGMLEARPILQKGDKFKVPGNSQPTRYVQPTLVARDAAASPKLVWISRELKGEAKTGSKSGDR